MDLVLIHEGKRCIGCGEFKSLAEYHAATCTKDRKQVRCKPCARIARQQRIIVGPPAPFRNCRECGARKLVEEFYRHAGRKDGISTSCKVCAIKRNSAYAEKHPDRVKAQQSRKYQKSKDQYAKKQKDYYEATKQWRFQAMERWKQKNPEKARLYKRVCEARRRAAILQSDEHHTADDVLRIVTSQRWKCAGCRASIRDGYHVDHVIPLSRGGSNGAKNIQGLCPTCNVRKHAKDPIEWAQSQGRLL